MDVYDLPRIQVERVILRRVKIGFHEPFRISSGTVSEKESIIVHLQAKECEGFGEASPMSGSFYSVETPDSTWSALADRLLPRILNLGQLALQDLLDSFEDLDGEPFAKAGLEGAYWDACANLAGLPLFQLLGGRRRPLPSGVALGIYPTVGDLLERVGRFVRQGYRRVKIKIQPGWDIEPVGAVREKYGSVPLMVDANASYTLDEAAVFEGLDLYNLMMIEQPLPAPAVLEHAELQRRIRTPICLDESAGSLDALEDILRHGSGRIINIKVQRVGGLHIARMMHDRCRRAGVPCWLGTMPELGIASAQGLHLATLDNFTFPTDVEASQRWFQDEIIDPPVRINPHGWIHLPSGAGIGYNVDLEKLDRNCIEKREFSSA